jgi:hypothetical protein
MLSTAMKAPRVAPNTAIQVLTDTAGEVAVGPDATLTRERSLPRSDDAVSIVVWRVVMAVPLW